MSVTISNPQQIRDNPLNTSTSKHLYSFSKDQRFKNSIKNNCSEAYYKLPECKEKRTSGFGYGSRSDFTKLSVGVPSPNAYQLRSLFDTNPHKIQPTFGYGRDELSQGGIIPKTSNSGPGPCNYKLPSKLDKIAYTMGKRTPINHQMTFLKNPGPGAYKPLETITQDGKYFLSTFSNSKAALFNPERSQRFKSFNNSCTPGPCAYQPKTELQVGGQYVVSKFPSSLGKSFPHSTRSKPLLHSYLSYFYVFEILVDPGPGSYRLPSDFGYYEANGSNKNKNQIQE